MKCPYNSCNGSGFFIVNNASNVPVAMLCKCALERNARIKFDVLLDMSRIPKRYLGFTFDSYKNLHLGMYKTNEKMIQTLEELYSDPEKILNGPSVIWIFGKDPNAGHTTFAVILGVRLLQHGVKVRFISMFELLSVFLDYKERSANLNELNHFDIYIIDDAFDNTRSYAHNEYVRVSLFNWLNTSLNNGKRFICTSYCRVNEVDSIYEQFKSILQRSLLQIKIVGSLV